VFIDEVFAVNGGVATHQQLMAVMPRKALAHHLRVGAVVRVWHGVYALSPPDTVGRLAALDLIAEKPLVACLHTAAALYGFETESDDRIHVLDPGVRMRSTVGLRVHQRVGAPLQRMRGRLATTPAWTAVEIARAVRRPRVLAVLDAALRCGRCTHLDLEHALKEQKGRRGTVKVRELLPHADGRAESPMESEARLVFIDGGLPLPELQYEIIDCHGQRWRVDFAWPDAKVIAEYESMEWHASPAALKHDRTKTARLQECGWLSVPLIVDDVRRHPLDLVARISRHLQSSSLAG
jgi:hypothetical protein